MHSRAEEVLEHTNYYESTRGPRYSIGTVIRVLDLVIGRGAIPWAIQAVLRQLDAVCSAPWFACRSVVLCRVFKAFFHHHMIEETPQDRPLKSVVSLRLGRDASILGDVWV